jgi:hypothetical protein
MIGFFLWALFGATHAFAQSHQHGDHQSHQNHVVSPFEGKKEVKSLHCLLRDHADTVFCPHSKPSMDPVIPFSIATDCGGKTSGSIPNSTSFSKDFTENSFILLVHQLPVEKLVPSKLLSYHRFIDSLDPPPRVL